MIWNNSGFIHKGQCTLIPEAIKHDILKKNHANNMGAASNTRIAKEVLFWPHISKNISSMCNSCPGCAKLQNTAPKQPMWSLPRPSLPWHIISQDLFQYENMIILLPYVIFLIGLRFTTYPDTLATTVINCTKAHFACHGIPEIR